MKIATLLVKLYFFVHGRLGLPGSGWLIRKLVPIIPGLRSYSFTVCDVGIVNLDFSDLAAFAFLNYSLGEYCGDEHLLNFMEKFLPEGAVLWDVGANAGYLASYFAHPRYKLSAIHLFEPTAEPLQSLRSLFRNHSAVHVHAIGLGDENGTFKIQTCRGGSQNNSLVRNDINSGEFVEITVRRGDQFRNEAKIAPPNVLKIDVEGFEPNVLAGLTHTIAENRPVIFFEHIWLTDNQVRKLLPEGYSLHFILDDGSITTDYSIRRKGHDAVLVPTEKRAMFEKIIL